jgi:ABC-2 type transport system permease protein
LRVYLTVLAKSFLSEYVYRANVVFTIIRNVLMFFILVSVWTALYGSNTSVDAISLTDMISYTLVIIVLRNLTSSKLSEMMNEKITSGSVGNDFIRPISFMLSSVAQQMGRNLFNFIFATVPIVVTAMIFYKLGSFNPLRMLLFAITAGFGVVLVMQISWIISLLAFWTKSAAFGMFLTRSFMEIFGGMVVPLWFYPEAMRALCMVLPFRLAFYSPASVILGKISINESLHVIAYQLIWIALLIGIERIVWLNARKTVTMQGG